MNDARFAHSPPQRLVLYPSRLRWGLMALLCAGFTAIGVFGLDRHWGAWLVIAVFGGGLLIVLLNLVPGASHLAVDAQGIQLRSLFRTHRFAWTDIAGFGVTRIGMNSYVGFDYAPGYPRHLRLRKVNAGLSGFEAALPDTYGHRSEHLADWLQRWHAHALSILPSTVATRRENTSDAAI